MKTDRVFDRWRRRYLRSLERQDTLRRRAWRHGDADSVHDLRVAIRRLRLFVRLASPFIGREIASEFAAWSRACSQATSALRDHDVVIEWLTDRHAAESVTGRLRAERAVLWRAARPHLPSLPHGLRRRLAAFRATGKARRRFSQRYAKRFDRLLTRVRPHLGRYFGMSAEARHDIRRQLRQLRYLRELVLPASKQAKDALLQRLARPQIAMGTVQNLRLVETLLTAMLGDPAHADLRDALSRQVHQCEGEIRAGLRALVAGLRR